MKQDMVFVFQILNELVGRAKFQNPFHLSLNKMKEIVKLMLSTIWQILTTKMKTMRQQV
jgi:hypothetical protein